MSRQISAYFLLTWLVIMFMVFQNHYNSRPHVHEDTIHVDQKVCIEGGGFFPKLMDSPQPFLVCGIIDGFDQSEQNDALAPRTRDDVRFLY